MHANVPCRGEITTGLQIRASLAPSRYRCAGEDADSLSRFLKQKLDFLLRTYASKRDMHQAREACEEYSQPTRAR